ncbi:MAG: fasciclin domain-containing protein [Flavobacteriaceae bacterium]|nr:fasciclin domain-containing protein [Flavobacteriaceae bacterium]
MKNLFTQFSRISMAMVFVVFAVSCESDQDELNAELNKNSTILDLISSENARKGAPKKGDETIATLADVNDNFDELYKAVVYVSQNTDTNVAALLSGNDQYTVFAPNDEAFQNLYDTLEGLLGVEEVTSLEVLPADYVLEVLLYHKTDGRRAANSVVPKTENNKTSETLLPENTFEVNSDKMVLANLNEGDIVLPNVSASNGIIHGINVVMLPYLP